MKNIVLVGFMGTGKTSTGKVLAQRLGKAFIDMDSRIEDEQGTTIPKIFETKGEAHFRQQLLNSSEPVPLICPVQHRPLPFAPCALQDNLRGGGEADDETAFLQQSHILRVLDSAASGRNHRIGSL